MSYCAATFRIDFDKLLRVRGSKDARLLSDLAERYPDEEDEDFDEDEDPPPALSEALAAIINGDVIEDASWPTWADASLALYEQFGSILDANPISPSHPQILEAVDTAFAGAGVADKVPIFDFSRVPPLLPNSTEPFPILSHMTPQEVQAARGVLRRIDWRSHPKEVRDAIRMIDAWIEEAAAHGEGLVCVYG